MDKNRDMLLSLFRTIKQFRGNKELKEAVKELRRLTRKLTPINPYKNYDKFLRMQVLNIGNMQVKNDFYINPKDCWIDNVLDLINRKTDKIYSKSLYLRTEEGKFYKKGDYFLFEGKVYQKEKFYLIDNKIVENNKACFIGTIYGENTYITTKENEEFITPYNFYKMYPDNKPIAMIYPRRNSKHVFSLLISCLLFKGKYRLNVNDCRNINISKKMLLDCEFNLPNDYEDVKEALEATMPSFVHIYTDGYIDNRNLASQMWNELLCQKSEVLLSELTKHFETYFNNLITFAKKEAEYEK